MPDCADETLRDFFRQDFLDPPSEKEGFSVEEQKSVEVFEKTCKLVDGRFQIGLPWRHDRAKLAQIMPSEDSEVTARTRTLKTEKRLAMRPEFKAIVEQQLKDLQADGISEVIPSKELLPHFSTEQRLIWYLPPVINEVALLS